MPSIARSYFDTAAIRAGFDDGPAAVRQLAAGYADGVNRFRRVHPELATCPAVEFIADVTVEDVYRMWVAAAALATGEALAPFLAISESPLDRRDAVPTRPAGGLSSVGRRGVGAFGTNVCGLGRHAIRRGRLLYLYNPHFPWGGSFVMHGP